MPNKTEEYLALACKTADSFSRQWEHWAEFLITAARLYKYSYPDQLMIYAQRPDATACAEYDVWNNKMNRYVRRGSKGIALLDESGGYPRLHYVFDVYSFIGYAAVGDCSCPPQKTTPHFSVPGPVPASRPVPCGSPDRRLSSWSAALRTPHPTP